MDMSGCCGQLFMHRPRKPRNKLDWASQTSRNPHYLLFLNMLKIQLLHTGHRAPYSYVLYEYSIVSLFVHRTVARIFLSVCAARWPTSNSRQVLSSTTTTTIWTHGAHPRRSSARTSCGISASPTSIARSSSDCSPTLR